MNNVEIQGLDTLKMALRSLPEKLHAPVLRDISRKPATKAAGISRQLFPYGDSGKTARTIGVLKVKNSKQTFVEVGFRGRSLGFIYISKNVISRTNRGTVTGTPWLFKRAGQMLGTRELKTDIGRVIGRHFRRYGYKTAL